MPTRPRTDPHQPLFDSFAGLQRAWPGGGWSWDNRLNCVASSISTDLEREARLAAELTFPNHWSSRNLTRAPALIAELAEASGGIRADQLMFSSEIVGGSVAYGLWWPWGDDVTISFRAGLGGYAAREDARLRESFKAALD